MTPATTGTWDWPARMREVAAGFGGREGVVVQFGDSITMAAPNAVWARRWAHTQTPEERAFLDWAHAARDDDRSGWYLATATSSDAARQAFTASMGCTAHYLLTGEKGLPPLARMLAAYAPRFAVFALGASEVIRGWTLDRYVPYVEAAVDLMTDRGTIPIVATVTPLRGLDEGVSMVNDALRSVAERRRLPLVDVHAQMQRLARDVQVFVEPDGVHPTFDAAAQAPAPEGFLRSGYLLRGWLIVRTAMEVKARVLDARR